MLPIGADDQTQQNNLSPDWIFRHLNKPSSTVRGSTKQRMFWFWLLLLLLVSRQADHHCFGQHQATGQLACRKSDFELSSDWTAKAFGVRLRMTSKFNPVATRTVAVCAPVRTTK